jgi:hypothetical protein
MSFRSKVSAIAITAAACLVFAPPAMASSGPVQVTGKQLKSALLPGSDFLAGYKAAAEDDSGSKLEHITVFKLPSMSCKDFWLFIGTVGGFGDTSFAGDFPGPATLTYVLWTIDGADVYMINTTPLSISSPKPTQASLTLKLITRVTHLR